MKTTQTPFDGAKAIAVHTAHGIETRYVANEARGTPAGVDVPRVSTETRNGSHVSMNGVTTEDRPPEVDSSSFSDSTVHNNKGGIRA